eukprot:9503087-Pyramimonas_sp.AAC.1
MLDTLPPEVIVSVFLHCSAAQVARVALVCRGLRAATDSGILWAELYRREFGDECPTLDNRSSFVYRDLFVDRTKARRFVEENLRKMAWPTLRSECLDALCAASFGPKTNPTRAIWTYQHLVGVCMSDEPSKIGNRYFGSIALRHVHQSRNIDLMRKALLRKGRNDEVGFDEERGERTRTADSAQQRARAAFLEEASCRIGSIVEEDDAPDFEIIDAYDRMAVEVTRRLALDPEVRAAEQRAGPDSEVDYRPAIRLLNAFLFGPPTDEEELERSLLDPRELPSTGGLAIAGNRADYYAENNSSMRHVLKSRKGIPITLAVLQYHTIPDSLGQDTEPNH